MRYAPQADIPAAAHSKAVAALEEFEALTIEYSMLLDTQRALLAAGNTEGVVETVAHGDAVARQAAACGLRLAPWRETIDSRQYHGPRATDLVRRLKAATARAATIAAGAASIEAMCVQRRDEAAFELQKGAASSSASRAMTGGYRVSAPVTRALDTHG